MRHAPVGARVRGSNHGTTRRILARTAPPCKSTTAAVERAAHDRVLDLAGEGPRDCARSVRLAAATRPGTRAVDHGVAMTATNGLLIEQVKNKILVRGLGPIVSGNATCPLCKHEGSLRIRDAGETVRLRCAKGCALTDVVLALDLFAFKG